MDEPAPPRRSRFPVLVALGVAVALMVLAVAALNAWRDLSLQRQREARLEARIAAGEARVEALRHRVRRLRDDPATLESLARGELGLVRAEDVVYVFPEPAAPQPATPAAGPSAPP
ncbi:MAG TPA: septum formation initiator family protein [Thermoanaerobaculia bacterium]|nr:septum formation initiator family protein [Thermoanaerobaculia bacterium]